MIHLIGFYTQGPPFDSARDLTESKNIFQMLYEKQVDTIKLYNTTLMNVINPLFSKSIEPVPIYHFLDGWEHHFWKWKPFVIYEHLKNMNEGDILVYHDCDILKRKEYEKGANQFRNNVIKVLDNNELVCGIDYLYCKNKDFIKEDVFRQFGNYRETKKLTTNRIFIKKNPKTLTFIYNWLSLCNTSLILPNFIEKHSYSESLFNILYYKYIEMGVFTYPKVYFKENLFTNESILFLDKEKEINEIIHTKKKDDYSFIFETKTILPSPSRKMLPHHKSNRYSLMNLNPIAKPKQPLRKKPTLFTLHKHSQ